MPRDNTKEVKIEASCSSCKLLLGLGLAKDYPDAAPLIGRRESEWMVEEREFRKGMQSQCEYQQDHLCDPDGILLDVRSQDN